MRVSNVDKHSRVGEQNVRLCNYVDVYHNDFIRGDMPFMRATATALEIKRFGLVRGDVLITKDSEAWDDIGVPALVSDTTPDLVSGYHLAILRPRRDQMLGEYLLRLLQTGVAHQFHVAAKGVTRYGLSYSDIKSVRLPVPPLQEQEAIVRYLRHATVEIDAKLAEVRRKIELLREYRARLISDVVTGKLDVCKAAGDSPRPCDMVRSGVPWLGEIPQHWTVVALKRLCSRSALYGANVPTSRYELSGVRLIRTTDITSTGALREQGVHVAPATVSEWLLADGDILVSRSGTVGRSFLYNSQIHPPAAYAGYLVRFVPGPQVEATYLAYFTKTRAFRDYLRTQVVTSTIENVNAQKYARCPVLLPPLREQRTIAEYLTNATAELDTAVADVRREVELLKEYRARLIADVVTGRLDVRGAADSLSGPNEEGA